MGFDTLSHDARYAVRNLRRSPGFTAVAILSLALGIGVTTVMFSVIDAVDLKPLPFRDADRLVELREVAGPQGRWCASCDAPASLPMIADWQAQSRSFEAMATYADGIYRWQHDDYREILRSLMVSPGFFDLLGVHPLRGRAFTASDAESGAAPVVVIGYELWRAQFGGDEAIIGRKLPLVDYDADRVRDHLIIGVMPRGFGLHSEQLWGVFARERPPYPDRRDMRVYWPLARLKRTTTLTTANAELRMIARRTSQTYPATNRGWGARATTLRESLVARGVGRGRFLLFGVVSCVLLIALVNVAGLVLIRGAARRRELLIRGALGATRLRLASQLLLECLAVALGGGAGGMLLAAWGVRIAATRFLLAESALAVRVDGRMAAFALVLSLVAGVAAWIFPALSLSRLELQHALGERAMSGGGASRLGWGADVLIATEIALGLLLLSGAGLLSKELVRLRYRELGFDPRHLYFLAASAPNGQARDADQRRSFGHRAREMFASMPPVTAAAIGSTVFQEHALTPDSRTEPFSRSEAPLEMSIDAAFFPMFRISFASGRNFSEVDRVGAPLAAIVNEAAAKRFWDARDGASVLGRHIHVRDSVTGSRDVTVVGVVANAKIINSYLPDAPQPVIYYPFDQDPTPGARVFVRVADESPAMRAALRAKLFELTHRPDDRILDWPASLEESVSLQLSRARFSAIALAGFAVFGLLLAAMGVYASVASTVTRRTRELGIRIALGAQRAHVMHLVLRRGAMLALVGTVGGVFGALALTRLLRSMLYGTSPTDPTVFAGAVVVLVMVVLIAGYFPARRATRVDPIQALRTDG